MKKFSALISIVIIFVLSGISLTTVYAQQGSVKAKSGNVNKDQLFNGSDLTNWSFHLKDASVDPSEVFSVRDGVIHISGEPFGYMRTEESYTDYHLHLEYRWPVEATNSGVFIHTQLPDTIWPQCIECQLAAGNAGDFICMNGTDMNEHINKSTIVIKKYEESSEKPVGEWNIMEVSCMENTLEVFVNGVLQNRGTGLTLNKGHICLQSEGKEIEFRNVYLTNIKK